MCTGIANGGSHGPALVAAEIVHNHDIAGVKRRDEELFDVDQKSLAVDGTIEKPRRLDSIMAQGSKERHRVPMAVRRPGLETLSFGSPAAQGRHVGLGPGLVDEDEPARINARLKACPSGAPSLYVGTFLLAGQQSFFCSSDVRRGRTPRPNGSRP